MSSEHPGQPRGTRRRAIGSTSAIVVLQYLALALVWGLSFLFMKVGLEGMSPGQVVLGRLAAGSGALLALCLVSRQRFPREPAVWGHLVVVGIVLCVFPFLMFAWAEQYVPSSVASILNATTPLMTVAVTVAALRAERPTRSQLSGLLVGFLGVMLVLAPWRATTNPLQHTAFAHVSSSTLGELACLAATLSYGVGFVYLRRFISPRGLPSVPVATLQVTFGALLMLALAPVLAHTPLHLTVPSVLAVMALGVLGTGVAYVWNTNVVAAWGAANASSVTYLTPLVGVVAGVLVLGESLTWNQPVGAAVVVMGILMSQGRFTDRVGRMRGRRVAVRQ